MSNDDNTTKQIDALIAQLEEEKAATLAVVPEMAQKIKDEAGNDLAALSEYSARLDELEEEADTEENQGQIADVKSTIDSM